MKLKQPISLDSRPLSKEKNSLVYTVCAYVNRPKNLGQYTVCFTIIHPRANNGYQALFSLKSLGSRLYSSLWKNLVRSTAHFCVPTNTHTHRSFYPLAAFCRMNGVTFPYRVSKTVGVPWDFPFSPRVPPLYRNLGIHIKICYYPRNIALIPC